MFNPKKVASKFRLISVLPFSLNAHSANEKPWVDPLAKTYITPVICSVGFPEDAS